MNKKYINILKIVVGILILFFSFNYIRDIFKMKDLKKTFIILNWKNFIFFNSFLYIFYWIIRTLRWKILLNSKFEKIKFIDLYQINVFAMSVGVISPFQSGELLKISMLKKVEKETDLKFISEVFFIEKIQDFIVLILTFVFGIFYVEGLGKTIFNSNGYYMYILIVLFIFLILILKKIIIKIDKRFFLSFLYTLISWLTIVLIWKNSLGSINININYCIIGIFVSIIMIVSILSFLPAGIGAAEVSAYVLFSFIGLELELAKLGTILLRLIGIYSVVLGFFIYFIFKLRRLL